MNKQLNKRFPCEGGGSIPFLSLFFATKNNPLPLSRMPRAEAKMRLQATMRQVGLFAGVMLRVD